MALAPELETKVLTTCKNGIKILNDFSLVLIQKLLYGFRRHGIMQISRMDYFYGEFFRAFLSIVPHLQSFYGSFDILQAHILCSRKKVFLDSFLVVYSAKVFGILNFKWLCFECGCIRSKNLKKNVSLLAWRSRRYIIDPQPFYIEIKDQYVGRNQT